MFYDLSRGSYRGEAGRREGGKKEGNRARIKGEGRERGRKDEGKEGEVWCLQNEGVDYRYTIRQAKTKH